MNYPPKNITPLQQVFAETLGQAVAYPRNTGRTVIIVGAGQRSSNGNGADAVIGNGRASAILLAREGAKVICLDKDIAAVDETVRQITREGGLAEGFVVNVSESGEIDAFFEKLNTKKIKYDGLVLNVGISYGKPLESVTSNDWDLEFRINVRSHMLFCKHAIAGMEIGGSIVLVSSLAALRAVGNNPAYESSKAAQVALTRSVAKSGVQRGIRCNCVLPGYMDTPMGRAAQVRRPTRASLVPFGRQGTGWETAYAIAYLISHEATYINAHALSIDGGLQYGITNTLTDNATR